MVGSGLRKLRDRFKQSIQFKLTCYFIFILLPLLAFSMFANFRSQQILEQELGERTLSAMSSAMEFVDLTLDGIENLSTLISTDVNLTSRLNYGEEKLTPGAIIDFMKVLDQMSTITMVNDYLNDTMIFHGKSASLVTTKLGVHHRESYASEDWYREVVEANGASIYYMSDHTEENLSGLPDPIFNQNNLILMRLLDLYSPNRGNNVVLLSIPKPKLLRSLTHLMPSNESKVYLFDEEERLIVSNSGSSPLPMKVADIEPNRVTLRESSRTTDKDMILRVVSPSSGWSLVLLQPENEIYRKSRPLEIFTYGIILLSLLLAIWTSWIVYSGISSPISGLVSGMRQLRKGNLDVRLPNQRQDELGYLTDAFNQTASQQQHLIRDIYEQQLRMTKTELKFLQAQINPHFLYNTLDSIYWQAKNYEAEEISAMVLNLSHFFRLSLSKGREAFTVEETFTHLQYYVRVQQLRFADQFAVTYRASEEVSGLYILKLLLQPLVENAILHGLEKRKSGGRLDVTADILDHRLILQVADNGKGIAEPRLTRIKQALELARNSEFEGLPEQKSEFFGLFNVQARIRIYYGPTALFTLESKEGEGTVATLDLPIEPCQNEGGEGAKP